MVEKKLFENLRNTPVLEEIQEFRWKFSVVKTRLA